MGEIPIMFIPNEDIPKKGSLIILLTPLEVPKGVFTAGHHFIIEGITSRGLSIVDSEGHRIIECPLVYGMDYKLANTFPV